MKSKFLWRAVFPVVLLLALAGCGGAGGGQSGGGPSGEIVLYTSEPQENAGELVAAFNEQYPDVNVQVFRTGTGELVAKLEAEKEAGGVQADVMVAADAPTFEKLKEDDLLTQYTPEGADQIDEQFKDPEGYYTGTRLISTIIGYNTDLVQDPPESWEDLTDPKYSGKIGMPSPDYSGRQPTTRRSGPRNRTWAGRLSRAWSRTSPRWLRGTARCSRGSRAGSSPSGS